MPYSDIIRVTNQNYAELTSVWEASVRSTHHFLEEEDMIFFKSRIAGYAGAMDSFYVKNADNRMAGFIGIAEKNIEMLFIHPSERGKGLGKKLLNFAFDSYDAYKVDVNEQNEQAVIFYEKMGFREVSRDELDSSGKPYPILHMELKK